MHWVQMPKSTALTHTDLKCSGYTYQGPDGIEMCKFHVDDMPDELVSMFPVTMSIRAPSNSLLIMIIGQDECIFLQFLLSSKMWVGPNKESPLLPKSEGKG